MAERINFQHATIAQLRAYGETMGLFFDEGANRMKMVAQLKAARPGEASFTLPGAAEPKPVASPDAGPAGAEAVAPSQPEPRNFTERAMSRAAAEKVRIVIHRSEAVGGDEAVAVGVNGRIMLIPRGEPVMVPRPYVEALEHAERIIYDQITLPEGQMELRPRKVPAYPFSMA
jgi:hypothetical protein